MKGLLFPLSSNIYYFRPIATSTSYIDPGNKTDFPKEISILLISTKYFV